MVPDLDIVFTLVEGPFGRLVSHRGITHSVFFGPVAGTTLGWLFWRRGRRRGSDERGGPLAWMGLGLLAMLSHALLDSFTSYGTQLLMPFSRMRFAWHAIPIVEPVYSFILAAGIASAVLFRNRERASWFTGVALVLSTAYLLLGLRLNGLAEAEVRRQLAVEGVENAEVYAFPTMLQLPHRRVVALTPSEVRAGFISMWRPCSVHWGVAPRIENAYARTLAATREGRIFEWFSGGLLIPRIHIENRLTVVDLVDLRYGFDAADPLRGMWGFRGYFDATGSLIGAPERFNDRPDVNRQAIAQLFSDAFPNDCPVNLYTGLMYF
jgi:inner membrane protein